MKSRPRSRAFIAAAVLLLGVSVLLTGRRPSSHPRQSATPSPATQAQPPVVRERRSDTPRAGQAPRPAAPPGRTASAEHEQRRAPAVSPGDARLATDAARAFLEGYLRFTYGRG